MTCRRIVSVLCVIAIGAFLLSCASESKLTSISITPPTASVGPSGSTVQFTASAYYARSSHPATVTDVTNQVTWASSNSAIVTIDPTGLATAVDAGNATITASMNGFAARASMAVTIGGGGTGGSTLTSIAIIPASGTQSVYAGGETAQFLAIGSFSASPTTQDLTSSVTWQSADVDVATINSTGLATAATCNLAVPPCVTTITASTTLQNGTTIVATSDLKVYASQSGPLLPSLTVYSVGLGSGTVVSNPTGINCSSGAGCTGNFVLNSGVTLTATPNAGSSFGGWSANCLPATATTCTVTMGGNQTVGVIFNTP